MMRDFLFNKRVTVIYKTKASCAEPNLIRLDCGATLVTLAYRVLHLIAHTQGTGGDNNFRAKIRLSRW